MALNSVQSLIPLITAGALVVLMGCQPNEMEPESPANGGNVVKMVRVICSIEFNGRRDPIESDVELAADTATAFEALKALAEKQGLVVESRGNGETCFVFSIGGVANEGAEGKNWVYQVDGSLGDRSSGVFRVGEGQRIQWSLGIYP